MSRVGQEGVEGLGEGAGGSSRLWSSLVLCASLLLLDSLTQVMNGPTTLKVPKKQETLPLLLAMQTVFCCVQFRHFVFAEGLSVNQVPLRPRLSVRQTGHPWFALQICGHTGESPESESVSQCVSESVSQWSVSLDLVRKRQTSMQDSLQKFNVDVRRYRAKTFKSSLINAYR